MRVMHTQVHAMSCRAATILHASAGHEDHVTSGAIARWHASPILHTAPGILARPAHATMALRRRPHLVLMRAVGQLQHGICKHAVGSDPVCLSTAESQHGQYIDALLQRGTGVILLPEHSSPDAVFVEDPVVLHRGQAVMTTVGAASRANEGASIARMLDGLDVTVHNMQELDPKATLDGGDVLRIGPDLCFVGLSARSNREGACALLRAFAGSLSVHPMQLENGEALHWKSAMTAVTTDADGRVLWAGHAGTPAHVYLLHLSDAETARAARHIGDKCLQAWPAAQVHLLPVASVAEANIAWLAQHVLCQRHEPNVPHPIEAALPGQVSVLQASEVAKVDGALSCCSVDIPADTWTPDSWTTAHELQARIAAVDPNAQLLWPGTELRE